MIIDVDGVSYCTWNPALEPIGDGTLKLEPFDRWWKRCKDRLNNLHPMIAEQWIFRHWKRSPYCYLPLDKLAWRLEDWESENIFRDIYLRPDFGELHPESDFQYGCDKTFEPFKSLNAIGTWNYPIVVIHTPDGIRAYSKHIPNVRFCLIEGHQRFRFLKAREGRAFKKERHEVFVLNLIP